MKESQASFVDTIPKPLLLVITIAFAVLTAFSIIDFGVLGIFAEATQNTATLQIFVNLILCALFIIVWLRHDTRRAGRSFPLWAIITLAIGAFGPLLYLLTRKS
ncbi:hypothetical protein ESP131_09545 [Exiguobacterium sp. U13-1]|uniref:DUF2834 domain-containing protein n=1 Tax=Exiguobacterium acetylicum TaxID=41170 RepID=A0ABX8GEC2_EXIAC|nr:MULTISPECIES: hypothetical protein [Exiguobacterium]AOT00484.1 hypothetical protein ESP131_09545 [Exiguobacterium sp. U13-1]QWB31447.1 DUF2834 domain-containing protein [Exiguobacterium acetylicum]